MHGVLSRPRRFPPRIDEFPFQLQPQRRNQPKCRLERYLLTPQRTIDKTSRDSCPIGELLSGPIALVTRLVEPDREPTVEDPRHGLGGSRRRTDRFLWRHCTSIEQMRSYRPLTAF